MRFGRIMVGAVAGALWTGVASAGTTNLVSNGSFEDPAISTGFDQTTSIPDWSGSAGIEIQSNGVLGAGQDTPFGSQYAELAVESASTYSQTVTTVPGQQYLLSFYLSARPGTGPNTASVGFTGNAAKSFTVADTGKLAFQQFTETLTATATQSVLSFTPENLTTPGAGDLLDNVSLTASGSSSSSTPAAAPLPSAAWMGMTGLLGLSLFGLVRRQARSSF